MMFILNEQEVKVNIGVHFYEAFKFNERNKLMNKNGWEEKAKGFHKSNGTVVDELIWPIDKRYLQYLRLSAKC